MVKGKRKRKYLSKTHKYLVPLTHLYDDFHKFVPHNTFEVQAVGIYDKNNIEKSKNYTNHIFYLLEIYNTDEAKDKMNEFLEYIREKEYFATDYSYNDNIESNYHVLVIELPNDYSMSYFVKSNFKSIYTKEDLRKLMKYNCDISDLVNNDNQYKELAECFKVNKDIIPQPDSLINFNNETI